MACACSSTTPAPISYGGGCTTTSSSGRCVLPRRVATPTVTPMEFSWASHLRSLSDGKLVVINGNEMANLDAPYDGVVWFNATTGKSYVGPVPAMTQMQDDFACTEDDLAGFPMHALDPGCHASSETPDRRVAAVRPRTGSTGLLYAHDHTCSSTSGSRQEMRPREIIPGAVPSPVPDSVRYLAMRVIPSAGECSPMTMEWYEPTEPLPYATTDVPIADMTFAEATDSGLAVWRIVNGKLQLSRLSNADSQVLLNGLSPFKWVRPRPLIASTYGNSTTGFIPMNVSVDLTTRPSYDAKYSTVVLSLQLFGNSGTRSYDLFMKVDGEEFIRVKVPLPGLTSSNNTQIHVPIPASKQINIQALEYTNALGTYGETGAEVYLDGWAI